MILIMMNNYEMKLMYHDVGKHFCYANMQKYDVP